MRSNRAAVAIVLSVCLVLRFGQSATAATTYNTPEKAGALLAQIDGQAKLASSYTTLVRALALRCTEGPAKIADMMANVQVSHKKKTKRTVKVGTVLTDLVTAISVLKKRTQCLDLVVNLLVLYDAGGDLPGGVK